MVNRNLGCASDWLRRRLERQRAVIAACLLLLFVLAWLYLLAGARMQPGGEMPGMAMQPSHEPLAPSFILALAMWWIMMVAMMLPSAAPAILLYGRVRDHAVTTRAAAAPSNLLVFAGGYLMCWLAFSLAAAAVQLALVSQSVLSTTMLALESWRIAGTVLIAAGLYQLSPIKSACLTHCRAPGQYFTRHWRPGAAGALLLGLRHGAFCVGCCSALMLILFVAGIMNMIWVLVLTLLVMAEKLLSRGELIGRATGGVLIAVGLLYLVYPLTKG